MVSEPTAEPVGGGLLDLDGLGRRVPLPDEEAAAAAHSAFRALGPPVCGYGRLEDLAAWLAGCQGTCPPLPLARIRTVVIAADHGIAAAGVSAQPAGATAAGVRALVRGAAGASVLAELVGAGVRVVDLGVDGDLSDLPSAVTRHAVRRGSGRLDEEDALSRAEAERAVAAGATIVDEEVDSGADLLLLGELGVGATTAAAVVVALLTRSEVVDVVGRGSGIDDRGWMRKAAAVRDGACRARPLVSDRIGLLAAVGGADLAAMTGFLVQAAARRTPVVLDGVVTAAAALVAQRIAYRGPRWWAAGQVCAEPAHRRALDRLELAPVVDLGVRVGQGTGALLAVPALRAASRLLTDVAPASA